MTFEGIFLAAFMTFWSAAISALVWGTYRRLEHRIDRLEDRFEERLEGQIGSVRSELAGQRADLTVIALAVGARSRASEG